MGNLKVQALGIDLGQRFMRPFAGSLHTLFQRPDGFQIFLHLALILMAEAVLEAAALVHQQIQNAGLALELSLIHI